MSSLSDFFPQNFKASYSAEQISPGGVIYWHCDFTTPPKYKYLLIGCCEPDLLVLMINSEINQYIQRRPELLACQVDVPAMDHSFLQHDSIVSCVDAKDAINLSELKDAVEKSYSDVYKGRLQDYCIRNVIEAVNLSPTMTGRQKKWITGSLISVLPES